MGAGGGVQVPPSGSSEYMHTWMQACGFSVSKPYLD